MRICFKVGGIQIGASGRHVDEHLEPRCLGKGARGGGVKESEGERGRGRAEREER